MKSCLASLFLLVTLYCYGVGTPNLDLLISSNEIQIKIKEAAQQVSKEYKDKELTILMLMKGAICVTADLIRNIDIPFKLEYLKASSYGQNGMKSGELSIEGLENLEIEGRDVLLVDDIFETGKTILGVIEKLQNKKPKTLKTLLLLVKDISRKTSYRPDYVLFDIEDRFVVGYGLDYKEFYRGLPGIYAFPDNTPPF
jgi:hypoxanthine phosphoribosyltransferase